jgi:hypothetical protein
MGLVIASHGSRGGAFIYGAVDSIGMAFFVGLRVKRDLSRGTKLCVVCGWGNN